MRAICDSCEARQPTDWKAGDLCTTCGAVARRERRCHWCVKYSPEGRFCRSCGGETVADELFAPARMLKAAGVDQFSIAAKLASLDTDHVEHLTRMYQRQAAIVGRHVDDLRFIEQYLVGSGWSDDLDDELTGQLPMPDEQVSALSNPPQSSSNEADRMRGFAEHGMFDLTRLLAAIAVIRNGWLTHGDQADIAEQGLGHQDPRINDDAALAFGHWRTLHLPMRMVTNHKLVDALVACTRRDDATIALRLLGETNQVDRSLLASIDPDRAFAAALALQDVASLSAAIEVPERCYAAALALARAGETAQLDRALRALTKEDQIESILGCLRHPSRPVPELHPVLWELTQKHRDLRSTIALIIAAAKRPEDAAALVALDPTDSGVVQTVLQRMELGQADLTEIARTLVKHRRFTTNLYGVRDLATKGLLADSFIPSVWGKAVDDEQRLDFLRFVREQLEARNDRELTAFVLNIVFCDASTNYDFEVRSQAWSAMARGSRKHLILEEQSILASFASVPDFLARFSSLLGDPRLSNFVLLFDPIEELLGYSPTESLPSVTAHTEAFERFFAFLSTFLRTNAREGLRNSSVRFLEHIAQSDPAWFDRVIELFSDFRDTDLAFECETTASRLQTRWWMRDNDD